MEDFPSPSKLRELRPTTHRGLYMLKAPTNTALEDFILTKYAGSLELPDTSSYEFDIVGSDSAKARKVVPKSPSRQMPKPARRRVRSVRFKSGALPPGHKLPVTNAAATNARSLSGEGFGSLNRDRSPGQDVKEQQDDSRDASESDKNVDSAWNARRGPAGSLLQMEQGQLRRGSFMMPRGGSPTADAGAGAGGPLQDAQRDRSATVFARRMSMSPNVVGRKGSLGASRNFLARYGQKGPKPPVIADVTVADLDKDQPRDINAASLWVKLVPLIKSRVDTPLVRAALTKPGAAPVLEAAFWFYFSSKLVYVDGEEAGNEQQALKYRERLADKFSLYNFRVIGRLPKKACSFLQSKFHIILAFAVSCAMRSTFDGSLGRFDAKFETSVAEELDQLLCGIHHSTRFYEAEFRQLFPGAFDGSGGPVRIRGAQVGTQSSGCASASATVGSGGGNADPTRHMSTLSSTSAADARASATTAASPPDVDSAETKMMDLMVDTLVARDVNEIPGGPPTAMMLHARWQAVLRMGPGVVDLDAERHKDPLRDLDLLPVPEVTTGTFTSNARQARVSPVARRRIRPTRRRHYAIAPVLKTYVADRGEGYHGDLQLHQPDERSVEEQKAQMIDDRDQTVGVQERFNREHEAIRERHRSQAERFHEYNRRENTRFQERWAKEEAAMTERLDVELTKKVEEMERTLAKSISLHRSSSQTELDSNAVAMQTLQEALLGSALAASEAQDILLDEEAQLIELMERASNLNGRDAVRLSVPNIRMGDRGHRSDSDSDSGSDVDFNSGSGSESDSDSDSDGFSRSRRRFTETSQAEVAKMMKRVMTEDMKERILAPPRRMKKASPIQVEGPLRGGGYGHTGQTVSPPAVKKASPPLPHPGIRAREREKDREQGRERADSIGSASVACGLSATSGTGPTGRISPMVAMGMGRSLSPVTNQLPVGLVSVGHVKSSEGETVTEFDIPCLTPGGPNGMDTDGHMPVLSTGDFIRSCTPITERPRRMSIGIVAQSSPSLLAVWTQAGHKPLHGRRMSAYRRDRRPSVNIYGRKGASGSGFGFGFGSSTSTSSQPIPAGAGAKGRRDKPPTPRPE